MPTDHDPDDLLPSQRGVLPIPEEVSKREVYLRRPAGRLMRLRSWGTALVGLLALALTLLWMMRTG